MRRIVFGHSNIGQFKAIHNYLNRSGIARSWLLCNERAFTCFKEQIENLIPYHEKPGTTTNDTIYSKSMPVRNALSRSRGIKKALDTLAFIPDIYIGHVNFGSPVALINKVSFPQITYVEFPSYLKHGYDERYPPPTYKIKRDQLFEYYVNNTIRSTTATVTPSNYAKSLFDSDLHFKIHVQPEGFEFEPYIRQKADNNHRLKIGFCARDLSSAKGIEHFLLIAKRVLNKRNDTDIYIIGSERTPYGFEGDFLRQQFSDENRVSFIKYLLNKHNINDPRFKLLGFLSPENYTSMLRSLDVVLYPLQFGSSNWGLYHLLFNGCPIIASNRCYLPEVMIDGVNGLLCDITDIDVWEKKTHYLLDNPDSRTALSNGAISSASNYKIELVANRYLELIETVVNKFSQNQEISVVKG